MDDHQRFQLFYGNNKYPKNCHSADKIGDGYMCPSPTIGGTGAGLDMKQNASCGVPVANLGRVAYCPQQQVGGSSSSKGLMFTATGQLRKKKPGQDCGCQSGGGNSQLSPINGYYLDVAAAPVGNRPVHGTHNNIEVNALASWNTNLPDHRFDCSQPSWHHKCV